MTAARLALPSRLKVPVLGLASSVACGALLSRSTAAVLLGALLAVLLLAFLYPVPTIIASLAATSVYDGVYLYYRATPGGFPVSALDLAPILLLSCALRLRGATSRVPRTLRRAYFLFAAGLVCGLVGGLIRSAPTYDLLRVARIELELLVALAAVMIAGWNPVWRSAVTRGVTLAGIIAAAEVLITAGWLLTTGHSFWAQFSFGSVVDDATGQIQIGNVNVLRTNLVPTFVMLPALCLSAVRLQRRDGLILALLLPASLVTLSRGYWAALLLTVVLVVSYHAICRRVRSPKLLKMVMVFALPLWITLTFAGGVVAARIHQAGALTDASATFRGAETRKALGVLASSPLNAVLGTGAGVAAVQVDPTVAGNRPPNALLENNVLSRWLNLTILSVLGTALLLLGAFRQAWRLHTRRDTQPRISVMALCLPAVLLGGVIGGTLMSTQQTIVFWVLAGTVLAESAFGSREDGSE